MASVDAKATLPRNRLIAGALVFLTGQLAPLAIPLVTMSSLSVNWKSALSGFLLLGVPEIAIVLSVAILGKAGFDALRSRLFRSMKHTLLPSKVSGRRYYAGLIVFLIPILVGWVSPYFYEVIPMFMRHRLAVAILGDVALIAGVWMMGGQFWDKLRALFVYDVEVTDASMAASGSS